MNSVCPLPASVSPVFHSACAIVCFGILAEPMAKEMAKELGIEFKENVPAWQYDKEAFKEHQKEEAEGESGKPR